jgi:BASS family bile acid:Na+ symporter
LFRKNDIILLIVEFGSIGLAIAFPERFTAFLPYPLYLMMVFLFFSFLKVEFGEVLQHIKETASIIPILCLIKLVLLPAGLFYLFHLLWPKYAIPVLLLSGVSTGVMAPFFSGLLNASTLLALMMVVLSSLLVPFTLPALVKLLAGQAIQISFLSMVEMLVMVVFIPALAAILTRQFSPSFSKRLEKIQFPVSMVLLALVSFGIFPKYSSFFRERPADLLEPIFVAYLLSVIYHLVGYFATRSVKKGDRFGGAISFANMNNVLIIVFSAQFFGFLSPTLAAVYMLPFFTMIVPLRAIGNRIYLKQSQAGEIKTTGKSL